MGRDASGPVAVEFALIGFTLVVLLLGAVDVSRYQITDDIPAEAARVALVYAGKTSAANAQNGTATPLVECRVRRSNSL